MTIELDTTLGQAEVLFLSFAQVVADVDRRKAEELSTRSSDGLRCRGTASLNSTRNPIINLPDLSENLRELLDCSRAV